MSSTKVKVELLKEALIFHLYGYNLSSYCVPMILFSLLMLGCILAHFSCTRCY